MKKGLLIAIAILVCGVVLFTFFRPSRPTIHNQPSSVNQSDIVDIQSLVRARGDRHFWYIAFSTVDTNEVQVAVRDGLFHRDRSRLYWIRRIGKTWQIDRVGDWEEAPLRL